MRATPKSARSELGGLTVNRQLALLDVQSDGAETQL